MLLGRREPRVVSAPAHAEGATSGPEAVEFAGSVGLVLDPWQADFLNVALAERRDGRWAAFEVGGIVGRQNGKGAILEARELAGVEVFGERLIVHTAHELKTVEEAFLRMTQLIEACPDLDRRVMRIVRVNGKEAIHFRGRGRGTIGARIKYQARSGKAGRGFSGDVVIFDEAMYLDSATLGASIPMLTTAPNPQVWYMASGLLRTSDTLRRVRDRALAGEDELAWLEWSAPEGSDLDDRSAWAAANPALGARITEEFLVRERGALPDEEWAREVLCMHEGSATATVLDPAVWGALEDRESQPGDPVAFAIDVPPSRATAWIGVAGKRPDGCKHVELVACCRWHADHGGRCAGTGWVAERAAELDQRWRPSAWLLDPAAPAGSLIPELIRAGVEPVLVGQREMAQACGAFYDAVMTPEADKRTIRHLGQPELAAAVDGARRRQLADAWAWHRRDASVDIAPLVAVTLAAWGVDRPSKRRRKTGRALAV